MLMLLSWGKELKWSYRLCLVISHHLVFVLASLDDPYTFCVVVHLGFVCCWFAQAEAVSPLTNRLASVSIHDTLHTSARTRQ